MRGTIDELVPNDFVRITTTAGESRRYAMAEVAYAGPASAMPAQPPSSPPTVVSTPSSRSGTRPFVTVIGREARLSLRADRPNVAFHRKSGTASAGNVIATGWDELCTAPCEVALPEGTYTFATSDPSDSLPKAADPVHVGAGPSTLHAERISRAGTRTGLVVGGLAAGVLGGYLFYKGLTAEKEDCSNGTCETEPDSDATQTALGSLLFSTGILVALLGPSFAPDKARIQIAPGAHAVRTRKRSEVPVAKESPRHTDALSGLSLRGTF